MEPLALAVGFGVSMILGRTAIGLGERLGLVDVPDDGSLKGHTGRPVPLGGLGILLGLHAGLILLGVLDIGLIAATVLLWTVGIVDDRAGLDPRVRLIAAGLAGLLLGGLQVPFPGWLSVATSVIVVMVLVNAVNLFDGLDALAGSVGVVAATGLAVLAGLRGHEGSTASLVLAATLLGFLIWNRPPARLFLGDNGAYILGTALAWGALRFSTGLAESVVAVALIGAPLVDLGATILRRLKSGAPMFGGDRDHGYDRLHRSGLSVARVAIVFAAAQVIWTAGVIVLVGTLGDRIAAVGAVLAGAVVAGWMGLGRRRMVGNVAPSDDV